MPPVALVPPVVVVPPAAPPPPKPAPPLQEVSIGKLPDPKTEPAPRVEPPPRREPVVPHTPVARTTSPFEDKKYIPDPSYPYTVLLGTFQNQKLVKENIAKLEDRGYRTYVFTVDQKERGLFYRLLVGRFKTAKEATKMADEIKEYGEFNYIKVYSYVK